MKVLVTSSIGLTGKAVVKALASRGEEVRAMAHSDRHSAEMIALGAEETFSASIESEEDMTRAMTGMDAVFYICPTAQAMFNAYNKYGFLGNDFDTKYLLGHKPNDFATFIKKNI